MFEPAPVGLLLAMDPPDMTANFWSFTCLTFSTMVAGSSSSPARFEPLAAIYPIGSLTLAEGHYGRKLFDANFVARALSKGLVTEHVISQMKNRSFLNINQAKIADAFEDFRQLSPTFRNCNLPGRRTIDGQRDDWPSRSRSNFGLRDAYRCRDANTGNDRSWLPDLS